MKKNIYAGIALLCIPLHGVSDVGSDGEWETTACALSGFSLPETTRPYTPSTQKEITEPLSSSLSSSAPSSTAEGENTPSVISEYTKTSPSSTTEYQTYHTRRASNRDARRRRCGRNKDDEICTLCTSRAVITQPITTTTSVPVHSSLPTSYATESIFNK